MFKNCKILKHEYSKLNFVFFIMYLCGIGILYFLSVQYILLNIEMYRNLSRSCDISVEIDIMNYKCIKMF